MLELPGVARAGPLRRRGARRWETGTRACARPLHQVAICGAKGEAKVPPLLTLCCCVHASHCHQGFVTDGAAAAPGEASARQGEGAAAGASTGAEGSSLRGSPRGSEAGDMTCAICLQNIPLEELAMVKGCDHWFCGEPAWLGGREGQGAACGRWWRGTAAWTAGGALWWWMRRRMRWRYVLVS